MKDCKFLLPFVDELKKLYPDHNIEWVRNEYNIEYEEIKIDGVTYLNTDIGYGEAIGDFGEKTFHANIVVHFSNVKTEYDFDGLHIEDPYNNEVPPVFIGIFGRHDCLHRIFEFLLCEDPDIIKKEMANLVNIDILNGDF